MNKWTAIPIACLMGIVSVSPARAGPWTLPQGGVLATATLLGTRSRSFFNDTTDRVRFANNGLSRVAGVTLAGSYGVTDALTVSTTVPVLFFRLRDDIILEEGTSLGDMQISARYRLVDRKMVSSVEAILKLPTASDADPARIQVGEGQYDIEVVGSLGWARLPLIVSLDLGYRMRLRNGDTGFKPGDEVILLREPENPYDVALLVVLTHLFDK